MKNGDKPIYPLQHEGYPSIDKVVEAGCVTGLTKREYFAGLAMQGLISQAQDIYPQVGCMDIWNYNEIAESAIKAADALLNQLGE